jgi:hypothetical protein
MKPLMALCLAVVALLGDPAGAARLDPFYADVQTPEGSFFAVRPFYSRAVTDEQGQVQDFLWPLYSRKEFKNEQSSRTLLFRYKHTFHDGENPARYRNWVLPVWFHGRDANGQRYLSVFPLGGTLNEFLGRDEITYVLFPLYGKSRINDVKTTSVLWPIYSHTRGEGIQRDRVFPLYGKSVLENKYEKKFVLWPFWTSADYFYPGDSGRSWILFPLCGRANLDKERTLWVVPPLFRFTEGERQSRTWCPWPFFQKVTGPRENRLYFWPIWGEKETHKSRRAFALWPFLWSLQNEEREATRTRRMALPVWFSDHLVAHPADDVPATTVSDYWKIWPLMSYCREEKTTRFRMLELWPLRNSPPVERNWAPFWTLYQKSSVEGVVRRDALWFVWNSESEPATGRKEWSLLKGLAACKTQDEHRSLQLLYWIRMGGETE